MITNAIVAKLLFRDLAGIIVLNAGDTYYIFA